MEESESAATLYDRGYASRGRSCFSKPRPIESPGRESRCASAAIRSGMCPSRNWLWCVNSRLKLVGLTIGNDMSSRDIEGENPLYLPQAKCTMRAAASVRGSRSADSMRRRSSSAFNLQFAAMAASVFEGSTNARQMARSLEELIGWLGRDNSFPNGVFLLTGTGIVPDSDFTLHQADVVEIAIDGLGTLSQSDRARLRRLKNRPGLSPSFMRFCEGLKCRNNRTSPGAYKANSIVLAAAGTANRRNTTAQYALRSQAIALSRLRYRSSGPSRS